MATYVGRLICLSRNNLLHNVYRLSGSHLSVVAAKISSSSAASETSSEDNALSTVDAVDDNADDDVPQTDISRMPKRYRDRMLHVMNPPEQPDYITDMNRSLELKRRLYAKYGRRSGIDLGLLWPSADDLANLIEFEKEWEPTLQQLIAKSKEQRNAEEKARLEKRRLVEKNMAKMPQLINEYRAKLTKADEQELQREAKRHALLEEARDYFGFNIDPRDPRFERMQEMKEEEEKKLRRMKKKEAKTARWLEVMKKEQQQPPKQ